MTVDRSTALGFSPPSETSGPHRPVPEGGLDNVTADVRAEAAGVEFVETSSDALSISPSAGGEASPVEGCPDSAARRSR